MLGTKTKKPIISVIKPGVNRKTPASNINKPFVKSEIGLDSPNLKWENNAKPCLRTKMVPIAAVVTMIKIVLTVPNNLLISTNTMISSIGITKNNKNHFISCNHSD